jgi:hypothetical protein
MGEEHMMPIINIHPYESEVEAEEFRLTLKNADDFGLYCCYDGKNAMWSVIPKIALNLIFNPEAALPVTKKFWHGLTEEDYASPEAGEYTECFEDGARWAEMKLKEKNT